MKGMYLGLLAGLITTSSSFPQMVKSYKTKSTKDLSIWFLASILTGVSLWVVYGFVVSDVPIIVANSVSLIPLGFTLYLKLRYDRTLSPPEPCDSSKQMADQLCLRQAESESQLGAPSV